MHPMQAIPEGADAGHCKPARKIAALCAVFLAVTVIVLLVVFAFIPEMGGSGLDGFWLKTGGEPWMSDEMKVAVKGNVLRETFPGTSATLSFELIADGREHAWFDPEEGESAEKTYTARLTKDSFTLVTHTKGATGSAGSDMTETWSLRNGGRELVIANREGQVVYRRASWLRRLFMHEP